MDAGTAETSNSVEMNRSRRSSAPTLAQVQLGARFRGLRHDRGLKADDAARRLVWPLTRLRELESARRQPTAEDLDKLNELLKLDEVTVKELAELAHKAKQQGWWAEYIDLRVPYIGLEEHASTITAYGTHYLPALLQTEEYAQAIINGIEPRIDDSIQRQRVEARMRRQHVLRRPEALKYRVFLDESVLQRPVGGDGVMHEQLDKVLRLIREGSVEVHIIPLDVGPNPAQDSNFVLLEFGDEDLTSVVFIEGLAASQYLTREEHVGRYLEAVDYLLRSAKSQQDSIQLIARARDAYERG